MDCLSIAWPPCMSEEQWTVFQRVLRSARAAGIPCAIGGGFAVGVYSGHWRETKDIDFYILPNDRERFQHILSQAELTDYYDHLPYDRGWIYRSFHDRIIVDVIWSMANYNSAVDDLWLERGPAVEVRGEIFRIVPREEMIWAKLYVLQRDRCDWPDVVNMICAKPSLVDWEYLTNRLRGDVPLLWGALMVCNWVSPGILAELPSAMVARMYKGGLTEQPVNQRPRCDLLDSRSWFGVNSELKV
jgi:hypothetical protein